MLLPIRYIKIMSGNGGYRENEPLDGYDPYSNSKSCSELVTHSYINSFYGDMEVAVSQQEQVMLLVEEISPMIELFLIV